MKAKATIFAFALAASCAPFLMSSEPAEAREYAYCLQGRGVGIPGECSYSSYGQCMASASGRALTCNVNPRVAFGQQRGPRRGYDRGYDQGYGYGYRY